MADQQKYALITGGASGIGHELAKLFAQDQYNLVLAAKTNSATPPPRFSSSMVCRSRPIAKDLFEHQAPFDVYDEIKAQGIQIEALVNNAGQGRYGAFTTTDINRELDIIQLNIGAYVTLTKLYLQEMVTRQSGKILQVSSLGAEIPGPLQAVYHGTKAFITSFTEAVREETKESGVTITILEPGVTDTDFFNKASMERAKIVAEGSKADPADVAKDGYEALMAGKDKVVSGFMNKVQAVIGNLLPDNLVAAQMHKQAEPIDGDERSK